MTLFSAIRLASRAHATQWRINGQAYIEHPLTVLAMLWELSLDMPKEVYIAAILHDVLEDTDITYKELCKAAGSDVAAVVSVLTKDTMYYSLSPDKREEMYLQRICAANKAYPYTFLIKLVDRLHNLQTSACLSPLKREKLKQETEHLYLPMIDKILPDLTPNLRTLYKRCEEWLLDILHETQETSEKSCMRSPLL